MLFKNKFNLFIISGCLAGYIWLYWGISNPSLQRNNAAGICIMKHATGIPCPSCGSTRSVISILQGNFIQAFNWNPLGFLLVFLLITLPVWIAWDHFTNNNSLHRFYSKGEILLRQKKVAVPALVLILLNWYWNIHKGL